MVTVLSDNDIDQCLGLGNVRDLATCQKHTDGITQPIHGSMNLCRQSTTRSFDALRPFFFWVPVECWWARTMVLSVKSISKSGSPETALANRTQVPFSHHRANRTYTLCQFPNAVGKSRHGEPVLAIQSTASIIVCYHLQLRHDRLAFQHRVAPTEPIDHHVTVSPPYLPPRET
jgi:hypothetical protein